MKLFICEKPSQGRDIARIVGATEKSEGCLLGNGVTVTWAFGHLLEMAPPESYGDEYKKWQMETLPVIPEQWQLTVKKESAKQFKIIKGLIKKATSIVIATDADREGEVIAREIMDSCKWQGLTYRLWLSALDDSSIKKALANINSGDKTYPLYQAGLARSRADWLVGMNLTRAFTLLAQNNGYNSVLSIGRVQTPTLRLVVERDLTIANFIPKPYWTIQIKMSAHNQPFTAQWQPPESICDEEGRCINESTARTVAQQINTAGSATVIKVETKRTKESAPLPFDLGTLQQVCSQRWGMGAQQVLDIAQTLYETHKAITYPRTDCGYLPLSMLSEVQQVMNSIIKTDPSLLSLLPQLNLQQKSRCWNDSKITAHHGIIPTTQPAKLDAMNEDEKKVYDLIRKHYIAQFMPVHESDKTEVLLECANQQLIAKGTVVIISGWKALFAKEIDADNEESQGLPQLQQNDIATVNQAELRALKTKPPDHFTEGTLIAAMKNAARFVTNEQLKQRLKESAGIGTEATRAGIIETLIKRGFLSKKKRYLLSSDTAKSLIAAVPTIIKDPGMTALWEQALDEIAAGRLSLDMFMQKQNIWIRQLIEDTKQQTITISGQTKVPPSKTYRKKFSKDVMK